MNRKKLVKKLAAIVVAVVVAVGAVAAYKYAPQADTINDSFIGTNLTAEISAEVGQTLPAGLSVYVGTERAEVTDRTISLPDTPSGVIGFSAVGPKGSVWKPVIDNEVVDGINLEPGVNEYPTITLRRVEDPSSPEPTTEDEILPRISQVSQPIDVIAIGTAATISFNANDGDGNPTLSSIPTVYYRESCEDADSRDKWKIARSQKENSGYKVELKPVSKIDACLEYILETMAPSGAGALYPKDGIASGASVPKILVRRPEAIGTVGFFASGIGGQPVEVPFEITDTKAVADYIKPYLIGKKCVASGKKDVSCQIKNIPVLLGENSYIKVHPTSPAGYSSKYGDMWVAMNINGQTQTSTTEFAFIKERNPIIKSATPVNGNIGSLISLNVEDISLYNDYTVKFGGLKATYKYSEYPYIKAAIPRGAKSGLVTVEQDGKTANGPNITVNIVNASANSKPVITSITPKITGVGREIIINGNNFDSDAIVIFIPNGRAEVLATNAEIISGKAIKAIVPYLKNGAAKVSVQVGSKKVISSQTITVK